MSRAGEVELCDNDAFVLNRDYQAEQGVRHCAGNWPMESDAAGVGVSQVTEAMAHSRSIGVPTDFNPKTGAAIFTSARHRKKYCEARGLRDRNAGYSDPSGRN